MPTIHVTDDSFATDVLKSATPVLVDFWAEWCGPCRQIAPALAEISDELSGRLTIAKVNVDENPDLAGRFGIRSIPTLMLFKGGEKIAERLGSAPKSALKSWAEAAL